MTSPLTPEAVAQMIHRLEAQFDDSNQRDAADMLTTLAAQLHDEQKFIRAYPDVVAEGDWFEISHLLSGKCRDFERKAAASNETATTLATENATLRADQEDLQGRYNAMANKHLREILPLRASEAAARERVKELEAVVQKIEFAKFFSREEAAEAKAALTTDKEPKT